MLLIGVYYNCLAYKTKPWPTGSMHYSSTFRSQLHPRFSISRLYNSTRLFEKCSTGLSAILVIYGGNNEYLVNRHKNDAA